MPDIAEQLESRRGAMKLSEFAATMGVCYMTAYRWVRNAGLPATKIAGTHWVDPHKAAAWWRAHSMAVVKPPQTARRRGRAAGEKRVSDAA
jgi:predicted site-specific integrase-resolvase